MNAPSAAQPNRFDGELVERGQGRFGARTDPAFWNQIGPFGGWIAAMALHSMRQDLAGACAPRSFQCTFVDAVEPGEFELAVSRVARKRTLEVRAVELLQRGRLCATAQCVFGTAREQPDLLPQGAPSLPPPSGLDTLGFMSRLANFVHQFDYRLATGAAFTGRGPSRSAGYVRFKAPRECLGPEDLLLLADAWFPVLWTQTPGPVPATTVTLSVVFHCAQIAEPGGDRFVQANLASSAVRNGYADETAELWIPGGPLLLKSTQLLWVRFDRAHKTIGD
jgi:hypothetical protein